MELIDTFCDKMDFDQYGENGIIQQISEKSNMKPRHVLFSLLVLATLILTMPTTRSLLAVFTTFIVPAYKSYKALDTPDVNDDKKWLTYWIVYGFTQAVDTFLKSALGFAPIVSILSLLVLNYLHMSKEKGTELLYAKGIAPIFEKVEVFMAPIVKTIEDALTVVDDGVGEE